MCELYTEDLNLRCLPRELIPLPVYYIFCIYKKRKKRQFIRKNIRTMSFNNLNYQRDDKHFPRAYRKTQLACGQKTIYDSSILNII